MVAISGCRGRAVRREALRSGVASSRVDERMAGVEVKYRY